MVFQVLVTIMSIINYVILTYLAHKEERNQRRLVKTLDLAYAGMKFKMMYDRIPEKLRIDRIVKLTKRYLLD
jgi:hypothetical protein